MIETEAWVLHAANGYPNPPQPSGAGLRREVFCFQETREDEVLVEPIFGCWEGNMTHAVERDPVDICVQRREDKVVIGNAGVVRVLRAGRSDSSYKEGDLCLVFCNGLSDDLEYPERILAYDAPESLGVLAKRTKLKESQLIPLPQGTRFSPQQWAAFSLRYVTAWANWKVAIGCLRLQVSEEECPNPYVYAWGGGVSFAEVTLARFWECRTAMISSDDRRIELIREMGVLPIDRRQFSGLRFDSERYQTDPEFRAAYRDAEDRFLKLIDENTEGRGVSVFIDYIGAPVFRATLKALARPGVITTAGWKEGMHLSTVRAIECMNWHTHVHTHYARRKDAVEAVRFGEERAWMPRVDAIYDWDDIPRLARDHGQGRISSYFPIFQVNPL